jgi:uroporphyrinogen decarboxylase
VGAPLTLAAYTIEGKSSKDCIKLKKMMMNDPALLSLYLSKLAEAIGTYACYQIEAGAQVRHTKMELTDCSLVGFGIQDERLG